MKIVVALDNSKIKENLSNIYKNETYEHDITYMEGVIDYISNYTDKNEESILITKDTLEGNLTKHMYIKQLRLANDKIRIILFVKKFDNQYKEFLFANEIFDIIEVESISIDELKNLIDSDSSIIYKYIDKNNDYIEQNSKSAPITDIKLDIPKGEIISIFGTSGAGKSYVSSQITKKISNNSSRKICLLDMDVQNPAIDIINNIDTQIYNLSKMIDDIDINQDIDSVSNYIYYDSNKTGYITNNVTIYEYQNKLSVSHYKKIFEKVKKSFDHIIVDLPASPFLDIVEYTLKISSKIFFVINPNYISMRQAIKYLDLITRVWGLDVKNIYIIVNKIQRNSLEISQIENILKEYKIICNIKYNTLVEGYINGFYTDLNEYIGMEMIYKELGIKSNNNNAKVIKDSIINTILKKGDYVNGNKSF